MPVMTTRRSKIPHSGKNRDICNCKEPDPDPTGNKPYKCLKCGKQYPTAG